MKNLQMSVQSAKKGTNYKITSVSMKVKDVKKLDRLMVCVQNARINMFTLVSNAYQKTLRCQGVISMMMKENVMHVRMGLNIWMISASSS